MKKLIFDSHALNVYLKEEPGMHEVAELITKGYTPETRLLMSIVNWGEVCYIARRKYGDDEVSRIIQAVDVLPIDLIPADRRQTKQAATFKTRGGISYADCFAAALAYLEGGAVVTGDPEFEVVEDDVEIIWIPKHN